jgi:hypothetical protein
MAKVKVQHIHSPGESSGSGSGIMLVMLIVVAGIVAYFFLKARKQNNSSSSTKPTDKNNAIANGQGSGGAGDINKATKLINRFSYGDTWSDNSNNHYQLRGADAPNGPGVYMPGKKPADYTYFVGAYNDNTWNVKGSVQGDYHSFGPWQEYINKLQDAGISTYGTGTDGRVLTTSPNQSNSIPTQSVQVLQGSQTPGTVDIMSLVNANKSFPVATGSTVGAGIIGQ